MTKARDDAQSGAYPSVVPPSDPRGAHSVRSARLFELGPGHGAPHHRFGPLTASSEAMGDVFRVLHRLAGTDVAVMFVGETGVGKSELARALHEVSPRRDAPFVVVDCGAPELPDLKDAAGGTLFLEEVCDLPASVQQRLLRVLDARFPSDGSGRKPPSSFRVLAATSRKLNAERSAPRIREDLFFRLTAAVVEVPPLRDRFEDVGHVAHDVLAEMGARGVHIAADAWERLGRHPWPGNVRELRNTLQCALALCQGAEIDASLLRLNPTTDDASLDRLPLAGRTLKQVERAAIKQALHRSRGNKTDAARELGIAVSTLYEKLKRHDI